MIPVFYYEGSTKVEGKVSMMEYLNSKETITIHLDKERKKIEKKLLVIKNMSCFQTKRIKKAN
jgi:hypothetical protein